MFVFAQHQMTVYNTGIYNMYNTIHTYIEVRENIGYTK